MTFINTAADIIGNINLPNLSKTTMTNLPERSLAKLSFSPKPVTEFNSTIQRSLGPIDTTFADVSNGIPLNIPKPPAKVLPSGHPYPTLKAPAEEAQKVLPSGRPFPTIKAPVEPPVTPSVAKATLTENISNAAGQLSDITKEGYEALAKETGKSYKEVRQWAKDNPQDALIVAGSLGLVTGIGIGAAAS